MNLLRSSKDLVGKKVFVRCDFECDVLNGRILEHKPITKHVPTIEELSDMNLRVILLAHQGSIGNSNFLSMGQHAQVLRRNLNREKRLFYVGGHPLEKSPLSAISRLKNGEILLLDNMRGDSEEVGEYTPHSAAKVPFINKFGSIGDFFVQDAVESLHLPHATIMGLPWLLPSVGGPLVEKFLFNDRENVRNFDLPAFRALIASNRKFGLVE